jgi:hypothetical protein
MDVSVREFWMEPSNRFSPYEGYRMNMEVESIKTTEQRKPEKHGCSPCAKLTLIKFSLFILNSQLKMIIISRQT